MNTLLSFIFVIALITFLVTGIIWIIKKILSKPTKTGKASLISLAVTIVSFGVFGYTSGSFSSSNSSSSASSSDSSSSNKASSSSKQNSDSSSEKKESSSSSSSSSSSQKVTMEDQNALDSAKEYVGEQYMSQKRLYDQLTSKDGDSFKPEAAQYAIQQLNDKYHIDWDKVALANAKVYQKEQHMSQDAIYQQLVSSYGEEFTSSQAKYAVAHLPQ